jgi:hypothetical protein
MEIVVKTDNKPLAIKLVVHTDSPQKLQLEAFNPNRPNTFYTKRYKTIKGDGYSLANPTFMIRMPQSPEVTIIRIYNEAKGNLKSHADNSFRVVDVKKVDLPQKLNAFDFRNKKVRSFIAFAQEFSEYAGVLSAPSTYFSDDEKYRIDYLPYIIGDNGHKLSTSLRISTVSGRIEVSKERFLNYTVPMRMMILLHEYSHFYTNKNTMDEYEADFNALLIFLGLGYPRIEAHQAWLEVFEHTPTEGNAKRYEKIKEFIEEFEKINFKMDYQE